MPLKVLHFLLCVLCIYEIMHKVVHDDKGESH